MLDLNQEYVAAQVPTYAPMPLERKHIEDGIAFLVAKAPFFASFLFNECVIRFSTEIPIAATDGHVLFFNPRAMMDLGFTIANVAFVAAHEVCHCMYGDLPMMHGYKKAGYVLAKSGQLPYYDGLMNEAEDYRINAVLIHAQIGEMPKVNGQLFGLYDKSLSEKGMESAVDIYEKLHKRGRGMGGGQMGFDIHLAPGPVEIANEAAGKREQALASAKLAAEAAGQGDSIPDALKVLLGEILDPKVSWQDFLRSSMFRSAGDPRYDWRTIDRRLLVRPTPMYFAKKSHKGCGTVVVGYDTSGSCVNQKTQERFFAEMNGIVGDLNPRELIVIWCDAAVRRVDELEEAEDLEQLRLDINAAGGAPGGGGTSFVPVFDKVREMGIIPDMLVYLTDAMGRFPDEEPFYPTIWAVMSGFPTDHIPFGQIVEVEL